ncbi:Aspartate aminotransferase [wastewater metagenome]|uniref:Aspartate aminotransferase n=2 Tax=unclassified sequences TaxID=12908 RepID=A0A5B8RED0_9ZZZZ|nr:MULTISPECIES: aminotransferase [Arhodomonas]QEA06961.1 aspartate aminotransferase [uncultured organism]
MTDTAGFNPAVHGLAPPPIAAVQQWARAYSGDHGPLVDLAQAVPGYPPHPDILGWLAEAAGSAEFAGYGPIEGEAALRSAYAEHVSALYKGDIRPENVHITAGCNQAFLAAVMAVAGAGDNVLLVNPFYFNHESSLSMLGIGTEHLESLAEYGFVPDPTGVEAAIGPRTRAVVLVTPNNPTGAIYPPATVAAIHTVCRRRGLWLIVDETYRDFLPAQDQMPHGLFGEPDWTHDVIQLYSFSKSFCIPGHRLGAVTAGADVITEIAKVMDNLQICAPRVPQFAVARALPALAAWREDNRREMARRAEAFRDAMTGVPDWPVSSMGAYFAYIRHPFPDETSSGVAERLARDAGVVTVPGDFFGPDQARYLRVAFANTTAERAAVIGERLNLL